jgi:sterol desaturase/sphingolipid hydroxylase (fatty acid hydroxylase superfamily)
MDSCVPHVTFLTPYLRLLEHSAQVLTRLFFNPGSIFSLLSLTCALMIAAGFLLMRRARNGRPLPKPHILARALFPCWLLGHASMRADIGFLFLNTLAAGALIGWGLLSADMISHTVARGLDSHLGSVALLHLSPFWSGGVLTLAMFIAYDFAYWVDHWLKHKVPLLWEFHRVHHTAEVLSPLTNFRMHPVDSLIFMNIVAVALGVTHGIGLHMLGNAAQEALLSGSNIIFVAFVFATVHLQHSHIRIRFGTRLGKVLFSPAHHHIHHSTDQAHFDSNLGSCLAVWDWMFGTLILPESVTGKLTFGADAAGDRYTPHTMAGSLVWPFVRAARRLLPRSAPTTTEQAYEPLG